MKVIVLVSGGLDSLLSAKLMRSMGFEVVPVHFSVPFCLCASCAPENRMKKAKRNLYRDLDAELTILRIDDELLEIIKKPKHGFGQNMNPCIDCRILMLKKAKEYMEKIGASFLVTGEVVGQRPMSQMKHTLARIDKEAGVVGLVLRPLSAKVLPETIPEQNGWIDRNKLLDITGRTRKPQAKLAEEFNITDYPCSSGGCLLTDPEFCKRLTDLMKHGTFALDEVELLKLGRHFRLDAHTKLVIGRDEKENAAVLALKKAGDCTLIPKELKGPAGLLRGKVSDEHIVTSASVIARYCDRHGSERATISYALDHASGEKSATPFTEAQLTALRI